MKHTIELRSDTYTMPTAEMRELMARAEVGNDGVGEDPTVNTLQEKAASLVGKEAALFVASGTMGNLCAVLAHCGKGKTVILDRGSHIFCDETGGLSSVAGCMAYPMDCQRGEYEIDLLRDAIDVNLDSLTNARTGLVCLENTHNRRGGIAVPIGAMEKVAHVAHENGVPVHLDGARVFNAALAMNLGVKEITRHADSVMFCLSKGLACPVGSILAGSKDFVERAARARRMVGGGMRQAGIIAAAGLFALDNMIGRLVDDHKRATRLADELSSVGGLRTETEKYQSNMVYISLDDAAETDRVVEGLKTFGVFVAATSPGRIRLVTHCDVTDEDIERAITAFRKVMV